MQSLRRAAQSFSRSRTLSQLRRMQTLPSAPFPVLESVLDVRKWRDSARAANQSVGFVATMGALHAGHLDLSQLPSQ